LGKQIEKSARTQFLDNEFSKEDQNLIHPNQQEFGLMMAIRPWSSPLMQALKKRKAMKN
jgi:hypothetical protein